MAKRLDSRYEPGKRPAPGARSRTCPARRPWSPADKPGQGNRAGQIGSLLVGVQERRGGLLYAGHVGTGFTDDDAAPADRAAGTAAPRRTRPFAAPLPAEHARAAVWVEPLLVVEVAFDRWTRAGRMRAPSYQGLRDDKDPAEVIREPWRR